MYAVKKEED